MALSSLIPESWLPRDSPTTPLPTDHEAPLTDEPPRKKRKIPPVAKYVAGAAVAVTVGLTALIIPHMLEAAKLASQPIIPTFISQRNLTRPLLNGRPQPQSPLPITAIPSSPSIHPLIPTTATPLEFVSTETLRARIFNTREERSLYGSSPADPVPPGESVGGKGEGILMAIKAFGVASLGVFGLAGLGAGVLAWSLGAGDMNDFNTRLREQIRTKMPVLSQAINKGTPDLIPALGESADGKEEDWITALKQLGTEADEEDSRVV